MITRTLITLAVTLALAAGSLRAQTAVEFEVASITIREPLDLDKVRAGAQSMPRETISAGRVDLLGVALGALLVKAFKVRPDQLSGPKWLVLDTLGQLTSGEPRFDIHALIPPGATPDQVPGMLQTLLVERFKLRYRRERRDQASLGLVVDKAGLKLLGAPGTTGTEASRRSPPMRALPDGGIRIERHSMTMTQLAGLLTIFLKRPIVDLTGLSGSYQVAMDLSAADVPVVTRDPHAAGAADGAIDPGGGASVFRSLAKLGLRLESRKLPADYIVIDYIEKLPTNNSGSVR